MKKNLVVALTGVVIAVIMIILSYFHFKTNVFMVIYTPKDSYAYKYSKTHFLENSIVTSKELEKYTKNIEEFSYKNVSGGLVLTKYDGVSERLVIPKMIDGEKVVSLDKQFLSSNTNVKTIVISDNITNLDVEHVKNIKIECYPGTYCNKLASNKNLNVTVLNNSDYVDFYNSETAFSYELNNGKIELVDYKGNDEVAIVPATINGYEVTKLSFDSKSIIGIFIPDTVKTISGNFTSSFLNRTFIVVVSMIILSLIVYICMVSTTKNKNLNSITKNTALYTVSILYLIIIGIFIATIDNYVIGYKLFLMESIIATFIYIVIAILLKKEVKTSEKYEKGIVNKTSFINDALDLLRDVDFDNKYDLRDLIRYSDPMSNEQVKAIEQDVLRLIKNISEENANEIKKLMRKRNNMIKRSKGDK